MPGQFDPILPAKELDGGGERLRSEGARVHRGERRQVDTLLEPLRRVVPVAADTNPSAVDPLLRRCRAEAVLHHDIAAADEVIDVLVGQLLWIHGDPFDDADGSRLPHRITPCSPTGSPHAEQVLDREALQAGEAVTL